MYNDLDCSQTSTRSPSKQIVLPVTRKQKYLLDLANNPECPEDLRRRSILANAFLVDPRVDMQRLRRAVRKLCKRHDLLRLRFQPAKATWRAVIDPAGDDVIRHIELDGVDQTAFDKAVSDAIHGPMPMIDRHLFEVIVISADGFKDTVVFRLHFAITDGTGMVLVIEDLVKCLLGLPILGKAVSFENYMQSYRKERTGKARQIDDFWNALHHKFPKSPVVGRPAKGIPSNPYLCDPIRQRQLDVTIATDSALKLKRQSEEEKISPSTLTYCAYLEAICACYGLEKMVVMTHFGRSDPALANFMGNHTHDVVLPFEPLGADNFMRSAKSLQILLPEVISHLPNDVAGRGTLYDETLKGRDCFFRQFSMHHPRTSTQQRKSNFRTGFKTDFGETNNFGPYTLTRIKAFGRRRLRFEMQLEAQTVPPNAGFKIHFDSIAYCDGEVQNIAGQMCRLLALEPSEQTLW